MTTRSSSDQRSQTSAKNSAAICQIQQSLSLSRNGKESIIDNTESVKEICGLLPKSKHFFL